MFATIYDTIIIISTITGSSVGIYFNFYHESYY